MIVYIHDNRNVFTRDTTKASPVRVHGTVYNLLTMKPCLYTWVLLRRN